MKQTKRKKNKWLPVASALSIVLMTYVLSTKTGVLMDVFLGAIGGYFLWIAVKNYLSKF